MPTFMSEFNRITKSEYDYLVLESVDVEISSNSVRYNLIYPEPREQEVRAHATEIEDAIKKTAGGKATVIIKLTKSHFDPKLFATKILKLLENHPTVAPFVFADDIHVIKNAEYDYSVDVKISDDVYDYALETKVDEEIRQLLARSYCEKVTLTLSRAASRDLNYIEIAEQKLMEYEYKSDSGRFIVPQNIEEFIGKIIYDRVGYIADANREANGVAFCGVVSDLNECTRKPKEGESEDSPKRKYWRFTISDTTGTLKCLFFPRKKETGANMVNLSNGKEVVVKGSLKENKFRGQTTYDMFVNAISLCTFPKDFVAKEVGYRAPDEYTTVFPERYVEVRQTTLFDTVKPPVKWLLGKTFCVFDVETTGVNTDQDNIIELAAVKVEDGVITETFSTFVNPHMHISQKITDLTSITDRDVYFAPDIEDVLPDFYKFANGTTLVGHYVGFDIGFINAKGKKQGIYFDNPHEDTLEIARQYIKGLRNYKLGTVLKWLDIVNEQAHRAIHDTIATAKAFIKLAAFIDRDSREE